MTLTFAIRVIYWSRPTFQLSSRVLKDCCIISFLELKTNIPPKFDGPSPKRCQVIKLSSTKVLVKLTFALRSSTREDQHLY